MDITTLSAAAILAIKDTDPERLFTSPSTFKDEYRHLAQHWHPDICQEPQATEVLTHINRLYAVAKAKATARTWLRPGILEIVDTRDKKYKIRYGRRIPTEYGELLYSRGYATFMLRREFDDLADRSMRAIGGLHYADAEMKAEFARYMPVVTRDMKTMDHRVVVMQKTSDVFLLRDVVAACGGVLDPRHAAWVMTRLLNIAVYLEWVGLTHNALSPDTVFISPKFHSAMIFGGWWYAAPIGGPLAALPRTTHRLASPAFLAKRTAETTLDRTLIRAVGRELLGDITGTRLAGKAPDAMIDYLRQPPHPKAIDDYAAWGEALTASYGPRRFVELDIPESAIWNL